MQSLRVEILDLISGDSYGLWEVLGWLDGKLPETREPHSVVAAELMEMLEEDLVEILHWPSLDSPERPMGPDEAEDRLALQKYWRVPQPRAKDDQVRAAATDHGKEFYYAHWEERGA